MRINYNTPSPARWQVELADKSSSRVEVEVNKAPKFRFATYSHDHSRHYGNYMEQESSCGYLDQAERMMRMYASLGFKDTTYVLVDWDERKILDQFRFKEGN